jgi:hypothetical protein
MIKKMAITGLLVVASSLAACGQSDNGGAPKPEVAAATKISAPEMTDQLADNAVQPISAQALEEVKPGTAACAFDSVDGNYSPAKVSLDKSTAHVFRGWALGEDKRVPKAVNFVLKGTDSFEISVKNGVDRPDVGSYFKDPSLNGAGFNFSTTLNAVPAGVYHVLLITQLEGVSYSCETKKNITVI